MTDKITVKALKEGVRGLATENTLKKVLSALGGEKEKVEKLINEVAKTNTLNADALNELYASGSRLRNEVDKNTDSFEDNTKEVSKLGKAFGKVKDYSLKAGSALGSLSTYLAGSVYGVLEYSQTLERTGTDIFKSSSLANASLSGLGKTLIDTNITLGEFKNLSGKYGSVLNQFGYDRVLQANEIVAGNLKSLGFTVSESMEYVADWLDTQRFVNYRSNLSQQQIIENATSTISMLSSFSKQLGISRDQLAKSVNESMMDPVIANFISSMGNGSEKIEANMRSIAAIFGTSEVADLKNNILQAIADPIDVRPEMFQYLPLLGKGVTDAYFQIKDMATMGSPEDVKRSSLNFIDSLANVGTDVQTQLRYMGESGLEYIRMIHQARALNRLHAKEAYALNISINEYRESLEAAAQAQDIYKRVTSIVSHTLFSAFGNEKVVNSINETLTIFNRGLDKYVPAISSYLANFFTAMAHFSTGVLEDFSKWVEGFEGLSADDVKDRVMSGIKSVLGDIVGVIGSAIGDAMTSMFTSGTFWTVILGGIAAISITGLMTTIASTGVGITLLKPLAMGLSAFGAGAAKILIGATVFGAAIGIISGLTGVGLYVLGEGLGSTGKGLQEIANTDGDRLVKAADGALTLSKALALLGAGKYIDTWGSIFNSVANLFGVDTGIDKMINDVAEIDVTQLKSSANAIDMYAQAINRLSSATERLNRINSVFANPVSGSINTMSADITKYAPIKAVNEVSEKVEKVNKETNITSTISSENNQINTQITETNRLLKSISHQLSEQSDRMRELKRAFQADK